MLNLKKINIKVGEFRLKDIELSIDKSSYWVLMGATGSGKSLLVKTICGLIIPESGSISIANRDVTQLAPRHRSIGYVPQGSLLFPHLSIEENILFSQKIKKLDYDKTMKLFENIITIFSIKHLLKRVPATLSGGERQKVALARALISQPDLLILDEPVSALDEPTRREFCLLLQELKKELQLTTIHVCHSIEEAKVVADTIVIMDQGEIIQVGTLQQLQKFPSKQIVSRIINP